MHGDALGDGQPAARDFLEDLQVDLVGLAAAAVLGIAEVIVLDHRDRRPDFEREVGGWLREGRLHAPETIVEGGIEQAPQAFIELLRGANTGKMLVRL